MLKKMNNFIKFDHDEFLKGKRFAISKVEEKFEYDETAKEYTDKRSHINVDLDIVTDDYVYAEGTQYEEVGVNAGERIHVKITKKDADKEEYLDMMGDGFTRYPVRLVNITSSRLQEDNVGKRNKNGYQAKKVDLYIEGDVTLDKTE